jgi:hypothetical protein
VGTVGSSPLLGCLVDLDVLDDQVAGVEALSIGIGFGVSEETEEVLGGLYGPSGARNTKLLACTMNSGSVSDFHHLSTPAVISIQISRL